MFALAGCASTGAQARNSGGAGTASGGSTGSGGTTESGGSGGVRASGGAAGSAGNAAAGAGGGTATGPRSDIVGKISVGYQGWFSAEGDGSGIEPWWHVTSDRSMPSPTNTAFYFKAWPAMGEITKKYPVNFSNLGNGNPATLFSSYDYSTVETHLRWMQAAGIDTVALQRFGDYRETGGFRNTVTDHVRRAAEATGRKFYVMYDISGWTNFEPEIEDDWQTHLANELHVTDSPAYAMQGDKPVVCIWGIGFRDRPGTPTDALTLIGFFQTKGFYVIGGVGNDWRTATGTRWSQTGFSAVYDAFDAISPWMVGVIGDDSGSDSNRQNYNAGDVDDLHARGKHYQPCVLPGDLSAGQRRHGDFMWHQFANMIEIGSDGLYVSMFDEFNEGNQIAQTAATQAEIPLGTTSQTLDEDGTACSADYYMRLSGDGGRMLRGELPFSFTRSTPTTN